MGESKESIARQQSDAPRTCYYAAHKVMPARICIHLFAHAECEVLRSSSDPADCMKRRFSHSCHSGNCFAQGGLQQRAGAEVYI